MEYKCNLMRVYDYYFKLQFLMTEWLHNLDVDLGFTFKLIFNG